MSRDYEYAEEITLVSNFHCRLKPSERNTWKEHIDPTPEWAEHLRTTRALRAAEMACVAGSDRSDEIPDLLEAVAITQSALYQVAAAWYANLMEKNNEKETSDAK